MERSVQGLSPESRPRGGSAAGPGLCSAAAASAPSPSAGLQGPSRWCQDGVRGSPGLAAQSRPSPRPPVQTLHPHGPRPLCSHALWPDPRSPPGARAVFLLSRSLSPAPRRAWRCPGRRGGDPARGSGGHRHQRARILDVGNGARGPSWSHSPWGRGCGLVSACQADDGADRHLAHFRLPPRLAWARQAGRVRLCPEGLNQTHTRVPIAHAPSGLLGARVRRVPTCAWSHHPGRRVSTSFTLSDPRPVAPVLVQFPLFQTREAASSRPGLHPAFQTHACRWAVSSLFHEC